MKIKGNLITVVPVQNVALHKQDSSTLHALPNTGHVELLFNQIFVRALMELVVDMPIYQN
jgi:hypothetical protein